MERIHLLIDKLAEQKKNNAAPSQMLFTVQLLQNELSKIENKNTSFGTAKVAVVMPANTAVQTGNFDFMKHDVVKEVHKKEPVTLPVNEEAFKEKSSAEDILFRKPLVQNEHSKSAPSNQERQYLPFDAMEETPTLLHQKDRKELHEIIGEIKESLNDKLKQERRELSHVLKDTPVKDLRKAIGVNDRYTFVQELFRGDEVMYERSIKTINGFHILPEAEYWINRELKVKLGWTDNNPTVQHFYQLVRRRFS